MKRLASSLACLGLLAPALPATSISFVGIESGTTVENWSNTSVAKTHDLNGDDRFGGAGYYQIMPAEIGTETAVLTASDGNDLGVTLNLSGAPSGTLNTALMTPAFLSSIPSGGAGQFINTPDFPNYSHSSGSGQLRQGSIWLAEPENQGTMPGDVSGYWSSAFSFTLSQAAGFRLGVAVDAMSFDGAAPDHVSVWNASTGDVFSASLNRDGVSDMVFFDVNGAEGDVFIVKLWQVEANRSGFALVTFDKAPTPTLICTQSGGNVTLSWEQNIPGWILESSTDLGSSDLWDPVPGVVNNSVTLSTSGVPKNFFRLRKDP